VSTDERADRKKRAAERAVDFVANNQIVGLGTGSTSQFAIEALGRRVKEGLEITGVPTSIETERLAKDAGIALLTLDEVQGIDISIDGADEVDPEYNLIKGGGGALTREKLVASASKKRIIIVDDSKLVSRLGECFALPVEVLPFGWTHCARELGGFGCSLGLRMSNGRPFETDNGNYILDCRFDSITDPPQLERAIKLLPGVIESGLFVSLVDILIIGYEDRVAVEQLPEVAPPYNGLC
jgi:ribose 5-phosphate isomerase A